MTRIPAANVPAARTRGTVTDRVAEQAPDGHATEGRAPDEHERVPHEHASDDGAPDAGARNKEVGA